MRRIGSIFSQTAFHEEQHVFGSNGPKTRDWADILFDYIIMKSTLGFVNKPEFVTQNLQYMEGSHHIHVYLQRSTITRLSLVRNKYNETYAIELYSSALHAGGMVTDSLDVMVADVQRIFSRYFSHWIAGIDIINNINVEQVAPPESTSNPFQGVFKRVVTIDIQWEEEWNYTPAEWEVNHHGSRYSAGAFKEAIEGDVFIQP